MNIESIRQILENTLKPKRYRHTLGALEISLQLADHYGLATDKIELAALLHDSGKRFKLNAQVEFCREKGIVLSTDDLLSPGVIHARVGKYLAENEFGIKDPEILRAIYHHPTGHETMSRLEKVLFASDYLDPNRDLPNHEALKQLVFEDFERGILEIVINKNQYVIDKHRPLHPYSIHFYNSQILLVYPDTKIIQNL